MIKSYLGSVDATERSTLDLGLSVFEGTTHRLGSITLFCRLRVDADNPCQFPPEFLVLCRDDLNPAFPKASVCDVTDQDIVRLVRLLRGAGLPHKAPRVTPDKGLTDRRQLLTLDVRLDGLTTLFKLPLEQGGFSGEDAAPLRAALRRLADLAELGGRPEVRSVMDRLILDRRTCDDPERQSDDRASRGAAGLETSLSRGLAVSAARATARE